MRVSETMDLGRLAELMGSATTAREAEVMRRFLLDDGIADTEDVSESVWPVMIRDAVELAESESGK